MNPAGFISRTEMQVCLYLILPSHDTDSSPFINDDVNFQRRYSCGSNTSRQLTKACL